MHFFIIHHETWHEKLNIALSHHLSGHATNPSLWTVSSHGNPGMCADRRTPVESHHAEKTISYLLEKAGN